MVKVFISYRRDDSEFVADSIYNELKAHFGEGNVFLDVGEIPFGVDFRTYLRDQIDAHDAALVLIGPKWADIMKARASRQDDFVRIEIESALKLNKLVIPVLVMRQEQMPDFSDLPESIHDLQWRNLAKIRREPDFKPDCKRLADNIRRGLSSKSPLQVALQRARTFDGKRNRDWQPYITTFPHLKIPDMPFCLVPVGSFMMGGDKFTNAKAHPQKVDTPYWIAQYPVTNRQWAQGVKAGVIPEPENDDSLKWYKDQTMADVPVMGVTWFTAHDFAQWMGCRLPTEREWEYAGRGVESYGYPWGNEFDESIPVSVKNSSGKPTLVTTRSEGISWVGAGHLSGNVWEWTASLYAPYPYPVDGSRERDTGNNTDVRRVLRGGSCFNDNADLFRCDYRNRVSPDNRYNSGGFRLALSVF